MSKIDVTVSLDSEVVEAAVKKSWAELFGQSGYRDGAGCAVVRSQVLAHIQMMDLSEQIKAIAAAQLHAVLADVVQDVLRTEGRKQAKALSKAGLLVPEGGEQ
jgi:hypothetical protein